MGMGRCQLWHALLRRRYAWWKSLSLLRLLLSHLLLSNHFLMLYHLLLLHHLLLLESSLLSCLSLRM